MRPLPFAFVRLVLLGTACASGPQPRAAHRPPPPAVAVTTPSPTAPPASPATTGEPRTVARQAVLDMLDRGIPWFLRQIDTEPQLEHGHFVGFRLRVFFPDDARFRRVDLGPGDVVLRVNGMPVERPEHAYRIWQELRVASEIRVEYLRDGQPHEIEYEIVDG